MVTIKDIAREAGVSCGTVSNVLNAKGNVSSEKINRVQAAIAQPLGYEVNEAAKTLRMQRSRTIAVIVPTFGVDIILRVLKPFVAICSRIISM